MKSESEPVTDDELVLRIVRGERFRNDTTPLISPNEFVPRGLKSKHPDLTGISVYRLACLGQPLDVLRHISADKQRACGIVGLKVSDLRTLGVTVTPEPIPPTEAQPDPVPGHAVIPELRLELYETDGTKLLGVRQAIAELASKDIRHWPETIQRPEAMG
jgi:hypothetical protein